MHTLHTVLQIFTIALVVGAYVRIKHMNQAEQAAFDRLSNSLDALNVSHEHFKAENQALKAENAELKAQLAAVPPPVPDDSPEVVAAANALADRVDAELALENTAAPAAG